MADTDGAVELGGTPAPAQRVIGTIPTTPQKTLPKAHTAKLPEAAPPAEEQAQPAPPQQLVVEQEQIPIFPENQAAYEVMRAARTRAEQVSRDLMKVGAGLSPANVMEMRFQMLMDALWPRTHQRGQLRQILFETDFETRYADMLEPMVAKARQMRLAAGTLPDDVMDELARQYGMAAPDAERVRRQGGG